MLQTYNYSISPCMTDAIEFVWPCMTIYSSKVQHDIKTVDNRVYFKKQQSKVSRLAANLDRIFVVILVA